MKIIRDESGQMLVLTALSITLLAGFMAMALDVSLLFRARRNAQIAADAAATAAALNYYYNESVSTAQTVGMSASSSNGITSGTNGATVVVNMPPKSGPNTAYTSFAEAIVTQPNPTYFMRLFGFNSVNIVARAVAGSPSASNACNFVTNPTASDALDLQGAYTISGGTVGGIMQPACGTYVASTSSSAIKVTGNGGTVDASFIATAGGVSGNTNPTGVTSGVLGIQADPFATQVQTAPTAASCSGGNTVKASTVTSTTVIPSPTNGVVCFSATNVSLANGLVLSGSSSGTVYVFENGVTVGTGATVTLGSGTYNAGTNQFTNTAGATMEILQGTLNQASNSLLNIYAPTVTGPTDAIAIMLPATNTTSTLQVQFGSNNEVFDGFIYAPSALVYEQDNGGGVTATGIVANTEKLKSSSLTLPSYNAANPYTTPLRQILLVE
jgi:Flp pilus assembly protein TadG